MRVRDVSETEPQVRTCRACGCTDDNCQGCVEKTGVPCSWAEPDLCSACVVLYAIGGAFVVCEAHKAVAELAKIGAAVKIEGEDRMHFSDRCEMCITVPVPGRRCAYEDCNAELHPQWPAIYCSGRCALRDAA